MSIYSEYLKLKQENNNLIYRIKKLEEELNNSKRVSDFHGKSNEGKTSEWVISSDGYYPYCKLCYFEPDYKDLKKESFKLPEICPWCGAKMKISDKSNNIRKEEEKC